MPRNARPTRERVYATVDPESDDLEQCVGIVGKLLATTSGSVQHLYRGVRRGIRPALRGRVQALEPTSRRPYTRTAHTHEQL